MVFVDIQLGSTSRKLSRKVRLNSSCNRLHCRYYLRVQSWPTLRRQHHPYGRTHTIQVLRQQRTPTRVESRNDYSQQQQLIPPRQAPTPSAPIETIELRATLPPPRRPPPEPKVPKWPANYSYAFVLKHLTTATMINLWCRNAPHTRHRCTALIDSGASISCISPAFAKKLRVPLQDTNMNAICAGGQQLNLNKKATFDLEIDGRNHKISAFVLDTPDADYDLLLGVETFKSLGIPLQFDYSKATAKLGNEQFAMLNSIQQLQETSAVMQNKLELPPQTTHQVTLKLSSRHEPTIPVLFVPKDHTIQKHQLMIPTCLVSVKPDGQTITVEIANPSLTTQTLHPQQVIGNLANMSDYNIVRPAAQINSLRTLQQEAPTTDMIRTQLKQANQHLSTEQSEQLVTLMNKYRDVLALLPTDMGCSTQYTAHLHLHPHSEPVTSRPYPIAHGLQERFDELIENFRQKGIISPSESEYSSPCLLVEKKTLDAQGRRQLRLVTDYRKLNKLIRAPSIRPPKIPDLLHRLKNAKLYTLCDLADAFYQVRIDPESTKYTAFIAPNGLLWEFNRLPQGLKSSPSLMCRLVALLTADSPNQIAYLDDVMLIAEDFTGMLKEIERFFQKLRHHGLRISLRKCIFAKTEVQYLGFVVSAQGIRPAPSLIEKIKTFPVPQTVKQLQSFLGLANFYRTHIAGYSRVVQPLLSIIKNTSKPNKFVWTNAAQAAFEKLKQLLSTDILLVHPNPRKPYFLHTDASDTAIGAVLSQLDDSNHQRPVAYISKTLSPTEQRYPPIEREAYAIYWAIKKLHVFLYASYQQFHVFTDHQPLKSLFSDKQPISKRLQKWILALQDYNFTLNYVKGKSNVVADCLSRIPKVCQIQSLSTFNGLQDAIDQDPLLSTIKALLSEKSPTHELSKKDQQYVRRHLARYFLDGNTLYFEDDEGRSRLVIPTRYREALLTVTTRQPLVVI
ncbi:hypothetical protein BOX15_Mlig013006g1 [Macrostomum lignano]|uniref:RNA-directed DNA polymerase n=1 Tax=Macrostomum lignano TaxID=282301 RepID=A0A267FD87_9PLAT|nr:hypothetical protein BOX15_Mlig013006g1 [Macrostomum lignano]